MAVESSLRNMALCLLVICAVCSAALAGVYALTAEPIAKAAAARTTEAISRVLPEFAGDPVKSEVVLDDVNYTVYAASKDTVAVGYAIESVTKGFGGDLSVMVGITADGVVYNTSVLSCSETPGLGAKCSEPSFASQFRLWNPSEKKLAVRKDGGDVDAITASTITSRAYTLAIANAVKVFEKIKKGEEENE